MARKMPYTNFHDLNLDWIIKCIQNVYNDENPPPYPVRTVNGQVGNVHLTGDDIPVSPNDNTEVSTALASKYVKPAGGIPKSDLSSALQTEINSKYVKPAGGIPESDLAPGLVNHLLYTSISIPANTGSSDYLYSGTVYYNTVFSQEAKVIEYYSLQLNNYKAFTVSINSNHISIMVTIKPNTNAGSIDLIIANVEDLT